jgi:hypothetical protein
MIMHLFAPASYPDKGAYCRVYTVLENEHLLENEHIFIIENPSYRIRDRSPAFIFKYYVLLKLIFIDFTGRLNR